MKKNLLLLLTLWLTVSASQAQIWIGGGLSVKTSSTTLGSYHMGTNNTIAVTPEVGYCLSDIWAVGLRIGYAHYDDAETVLIDQTLMGQSNEFSVAPFVRYTFYQTGAFSFFADGALAYRAIHKSGYDSNMNTLGLNIGPGVQMAINKKVGLTARMGFAGYEHSWMKDRGMKLKNNRFSLDVFSDFTFGAYFNL